MRTMVKIILALCISMSAAHGKVVVFWQDGFPTLESQPVPQETLRKALDGLQPEFTSLEGLNQQETLCDAERLAPTSPYEQDSTRPLPPGAGKW